MLRHRLSPALVFALLAACSPAWAEKDANPLASEASSKFIRLLRDAKEDPIAMQTAIARYGKKDADGKEIIVELIGAVHIGDAAYYQSLNKEFEQYDALLYELVAKQGTKVPKEGARSSHPVGMMQQGMTGVLELDYQLECIDYHKKNFVHADMSPDDFSKSMADRGESIWSMIFRMMGQGIAQQSKNSERSTEAELLAAFFDKNRAMALKRVLAQQFEDLEGSMNIFDGPEGSTIITERNKVALEVLRKEIAEGKQRLGIFYGAGHLPDMEKRLLSDFGLKRQSERWLTAWDLQEKPKANKAKPAKKKAS
jgi:hypothetical protein